MDTIIQLSPREVWSLFDALEEMQTSGISSLRVCVDGDNVKFKINERTWSPPMGTLDPNCQRAER